jgi:hypothetical protein
MSSMEIFRLLASESAVATTYYQQIRGSSRLPDDGKWDRLRRIADDALHGHFREKIAFAALSTERRWLETYGEGAVFFKEEMIAHRATVCESNTATWVDEETGKCTIPFGSRATWDDRAELAVAKLEESVLGAQTDWASMLLQTGESSAEDVFIEVHIYGEFTARSIQALAIKQEALSPLGTRLLREANAAHGLSYQLLP